MQSEFLTVTGMAYLLLTHAQEHAHVCIFVLAFPSVSNSFTSFLESNLGTCNYQYVDDNSY